LLETFTLEFRIDFMLLCGEENLRVVVLFPMNQRAEDLMMGAPPEVSPRRLGGAAYSGGEVGLRKTNPLDREQIRLRFSVRVQRRQPFSSDEAARDVRLPRMLTAWLPAIRRLQGDFRKYRESRRFGSPENPCDPTSWTARSRCERAGSNTIRVRPTPARILRFARSNSRVAASS
jgi:hypothetical protein